MQRRLRESSSINRSQDTGACAPRRSSPANSCAWSPTLASCVPECVSEGKANRALLLVAVAVAAVLGTAHGATYTVGAPAGSWDLSTNYTRWASGIGFRAGDQLVFKYSRAAHNVVEVSKADYDSCSNSSPLATFSTGDDVVLLPVGDITRYFICGVPGHCDGGMKLAVRVEAAATTGGPNYAAPSPAQVAMAPRAGRPPMASPGARTTTAGGPVMPPSSSASPAAVQSLVGFSFVAFVAALMAFF